jgi:hypothetical protein
VEGDKEDKCRALYKAFMEKHSFCRKMARALMEQSGVKKEDEPIRRIR